MKLSYLLILWVIILSPFRSSGQFCTPPDDVKPIDISACEGDIFTALGGIYMSHEIYGVFHSDPNCQYEEIYNRPNQGDFKIEGEGLVEFVTIPLKNSYNQDILLIAAIKFKATRSTTITITDVQKEKVTFDGEKCMSVCEDYKRKTIYVINVKVAPKKAPTLTSSKAVVQADREPVSFQISGCDPDYYWGVYSFQPTCEEPKPLSDTRGPGETITGFSRDLILSKSLTYYVRCTNNNCYSDWSEAAHVEAVPTGNPCNSDPDLDEANKIQQELSRIDNHYYKVETVICIKKENPNCTRQKVFETLLSNKTYSTPIAGDLPGIPLFASKLVFKDDDRRVESCQTANLPSASAIIINLITLASAPEYFPIIREATALSPIANPIGQYIDAGSYSVINYTKSAHIFYPGRVIRTVIEDCDSIKIITNGIGNSRFGPTGIGQLISKVNKEQGEKIFRNADQRVINAFNQLPK